MKNHPASRVIYEENAVFLLQGQGFDAILSFIQHSVNVDGIAFEMVEGQIVSVDDEPIIALYVEKDIQGDARQGKFRQLVDCVHDTVDGIDSRVRIFQFKGDVFPNIVEVGQCFSSPDFRPLLSSLISLT